MNEPDLIPLALRFVADRIEPLRIEQEEMRSAMVQARLKGATVEQIANAAQCSTDAVVVRIGEEACSEFVKAEELLDAAIEIAKSCGGGSDDELRSALDELRAYLDENREALDGEWRKAFELAATVGGFRDEWT